MKDNNKQFILNITSSILAFLINTGIQFIITPIITRQVGDEAYGFITIANDFISYANIFATILNSVAARYISINIHRNNIDRAEQYFNSILIGNFIISFVLAVFGSIVIFRFDNVLNVSPQLIPDIRILFAVTFLNYIVSILISVFTVSTFVKNRLDISSIRSIISYLVRLTVVIMLFGIIPVVKVYYLAIATLTSTLFLGIANVNISKKIMPEVRLRRGRFRLSLIFELLKTGIWMSINNLSNVIAGNFTTVLININISSTKAGFYSVAQTVPSAANSLAYAIYSVFVPTFYKLYAEEKKEALITYVKRSMKIMSFLVVVPLMVLCVRGKELLSLWQSYRDESEIFLMTILFIISTMLVIIVAPLLPLAQMGMVTNKLKLQTIVDVVISSLSLFGTYFVINFTEFDLIGIVVSSLVIMGSKWIFFAPIYAARVLKAPVLVFFKENVRLIFCEVVTCSFLYVISKMVLVSTWKSLIAMTVVQCIIGLLLMFLLLFEKEEKRQLKNMISSGIKRFVV